MIKHGPQIVSDHSLHALRHRVREWGIGVFTAGGGNADFIVPA